MDETAVKQPIVASYNVKVTIRGPEGTEAPTVESVEEQVESAFADFDLTVRASAERTDK